MEHTAGALAGPVRKSARNEGMKEPNYDEDQYYYEDQCSDDASSDGSSSAGGSAPTEEGTHPQGCMQKCTTASAIMRGSRYEDTPYSVKIVEDKGYGYMVHWFGYGKIPDCVVNNDDMGPLMRPKPYMLFEEVNAAKRF